MTNNKKLVSYRLQKTIDMLRGLKPVQFNYGSLIADYDKKNECGTVCCALGWYPKYFPEAGLEWYKESDVLSLRCSSNSSIGIIRPIIEYHGLKEIITDILFYGITVGIILKEEINIDDYDYPGINIKSSKGMPNRYYDIGLIMNPSSSLEHVINMFLLIQNLVDKDLLGEKYYCPIKDASILESEYLRGKSPIFESQTKTNSMKEIVYHMACLIMERRGKTSTKEVKDALHLVFGDDPTFSLTQKETSAMMNELYDENNNDAEQDGNHWKREMNKNGLFHYYEYSFGKADDTDPAKFYGTNYSNTTVLTPSQQAAKQADLDPVTTSTVSNVSIKPWNDKGLNPAAGKYVSYISGLHNTYLQGKDKLETGRSVFKKYKGTPMHRNLTYDDINTCTVEYFNKHHFDKI